jgi:hypothetical protein
MTRHPMTVPLAILLVAAMTSLVAAQRNRPSYDDPRQTDEDFDFQGEYSGELIVDGEPVQVGIQVIALGKGQFRAVSHIGGLPGAGWNGEEKRQTEGQLSEGRVVFEDEHARGELKDGAMTVAAKATDVRGSLRKVHRKSPTLGLEPPSGAVVLFDGSHVDRFQNARMTEDGLLMQGCTSKAVFGNHAVHIEFRLPYEPLNRGQGRGNSGIYLQGRYEVQMLDSFGLEGKHNECGGIYEVKDSDVNMCFPPLSWQTYDIDFTAAKFENEKLVEPARMTVRHNGVVVHENVELPRDRSTRAAPLNPGPEPGPVYLQDHRNPVRYRNIWVLPKD